MTWKTKANSFLWLGAPGGRLGFCEGGRGWIFWGTPKDFGMFPLSKQISPGCRCRLLCKVQCCAVQCCPRLCRSSPVSIIGMEASLSSHLIDLYLAWHRLNVTRGHESPPAQPRRGLRAPYPLDEVINLFKIKIKIMMMMMDKSAHVLLQ